MTKRANPPALSRALVQDNVPALVTERLWIGSIHAAFNSASMQARGITHVLNASGLPATFPRQFTYFTVDIRDRESSNILTAIGAVNIFVEAGIEKGGVLVHCAGGRSRSAAFVVAFIMSTQGCSYDTAYAQVRRARPVASVNRGFEQQLRAYGAAQCDVFAAHQMMLRVRAAALLDRRNLLLLRRSSGGASSDAAGGGGGSGGGAAGAGEQAKLPPPPLAQQQGAIGAVAGAVSTTGIPPTPRSPRGRGRSPAAGNPATYRQRRGSGGATLGGGDGGSAITTGPMAVAPGVSKGREDKTQFLPKEPRPTRFRLCRPESAPVQVIPPLKNLERVYACKGCGAFLLTGGHIIKNMDLPSLQAVLVRSSPRSSPGQHTPDVSASPQSAITEGSTASTSSIATSQQQSPPCGGGSCGSGCSGNNSVATRGRGDRRSPSPLSERRGQSRVTTTTSVSSGSPTTRRSTTARRPPPSLRVMTTELGLDRPPAVHNRWVPEGSLPGVPTGSGTGAGAAATAAGAAVGPPLPGATATVGSAGGNATEGLRVQSPLGHTPSPSRLKACAAGRGSTGAAGGRYAGWTGDIRCGDGQRSSTVFVFESEDESSTVDPSEKEGMLGETSSLGVDALNSSSVDRSVSSTGSAGGGWEVPGAGGFGGVGSGRFRQGRVKNAVGTPPNAALQAGEFNFLLSSKVPLSAGSGMESVSPLMTPRSPRTPASCGSASPCASDASFSTSLSRPQSAEKRQFLMRMNVDSRTLATSGPSSCPETDSQTERILSRPACRWLHVDLLDWMGDIMVAPTGRICCPNTGCGIELGNWTWEKPEVVALKSPTGPPLIRLDKAQIKPTSIMRSNLDSRSSLSRDNTPKSSPKSSSAPAANAGNTPNASHSGGATTLSESDLRRSSGILESRLAGLSASPQNQWQARLEPRGSPPG